MAETKFPNWAALNTNERLMLQKRLIECFPGASSDQRIQYHEYYDNVLEEAARKYLAGDATWADFNEV